MLNKKQELEEYRSRKKNRDKVISPNLLKIPKEKQKPDRRGQHRQPHNLKSKTNSKLKQVNLFNSLRDLPVTRLNIKKTSKTKHSKQQPHRPSLENENGIEDSTASREFRQGPNKEYSHPNREYFGNRLSSMEQRNQHSSDKKGKSKVMSKQVPSSNRKKTWSLEKKIKDYRRLSSNHKSESESLKSEISDKQMRRLNKMQSIEKIVIMKEIMILESKRLHLKTDK